MGKLQMHSPDFTEQHIEQLAELFPHCITEGKDDDGAVRRMIDFEQLRQDLSSSIVDGARERYHLNWPGKKEALLAANAPIAKTLRPCARESVDFESTKNLFIEGDNLDALKLLQETYLNGVKLIYIDPPYNTGNDFIYDDDFSESAGEYFTRSNQRDETGNRLIANPDANGRFHSDWLSMLYPRLRLAANLLRDDGVILISIDDGEVGNLRKLCDEVFGEDQFIAQFIWKSRQNKDNRSQNGASIDHEYVLAYGKRIRGSERNRSGYSNPDEDPRGDWTSANMVGLATADRRPNLHYDLINPETGQNFGCPKMGWRYDRNTMSKLIENKEILWPDSSEGRPRRKAFFKDLTSEYTGFSSLIGKDVYTRNGTADIEDLFGRRVMDFPKPVALLKELLQQGSNDDSDIILDFFCGSATTAHAVMALNSEDGVKRRFVMVQLPEPCDDNTEATRAGFSTIADLAKERIRRAGENVRDTNTIVSGELDIGFRVLKVDTSNMKDVYYAPDGVKQGDLLDQIENIKEDRTPEDLLFQVLLDWGVDLSLPIAEEAIEGKTIFFVDENALAACFDKEINEELVKKLAARKPLRAVFRDSGYGNDSVKINVEQIFKLISPSTEVKSI